MPGEAFVLSAGRMRVPVLPVPGTGDLSLAAGLPVVWSNRLSLNALLSSLLVANGLVHVFLFVAAVVWCARSARSRAAWLSVLALGIPLAVAASFATTDLVHALPETLSVLAGAMGSTGMDLHLPAFAPALRDAVICAVLILAASLLWGGFRAFQRQSVWPAPLLALPMIVLVLALPFGPVAFMPEAEVAAGEALAQRLGQGAVLLSLATALALSVISVEQVRRVEGGLRRPLEAGGRALLPSERMLARLLRAASLVPALALPFCLWEPASFDGALASPVSGGFWFVPLTSLLVLFLLGVALCLPVIGRERAEDTLADLRETDPLTDLPNRARFLAELRQALKDDATGGTLLLMDIDHFKRINETHGHGGGDRVLQAFAGFLRSFALDTTLCGRLGSAEFALYLRGLNGAQLDMLASQICRATGILPCEYRGKSIRFTVSVGVADTVTAGLAFEPLYEQADQALAQAREAGRDRASRYVPRKGLGSGASGTQIEGGSASVGEVRPVARLPFKLRAKAS